MDNFYGFTYFFRKLPTPNHEQKININILEQTVVQNIIPNIYTLHNFSCRIIQNNSVIIEATITCIHHFFFNIFWISLNGCSAYAIQYSGERKWEKGEGEVQKSQYSLLNEFLLIINYFIILLFKDYFSNFFFKFFYWF